MNGGDAKQSTDPGATAWTLKLVLFVLPATMVSIYVRHGHDLIFGASFVAGALMQSLIPPRTYRLKLIFTIAILAAILIPVTSRLVGVN